MFQILSSLLSSETDLELKTEINKPLHWASLKTFSDFLGSIDMPLSQKVLTEFVKTCFKYYISKDRKSRDEIIKALRNVSDKMVSDNNNQVNLDGV